MCNMPELKALWARDSVRESRVQLHELWGDRLWNQFFRRSAAIRGSLESFRLRVFTFGAHAQFKR